VLLVRAQEFACKFCLPIDFLAGRLKVPILQLSHATPTCQVRTRIHGLTRGNFYNRHCYNDDVLTFVPIIVTYTPPAQLGTPSGRYAWSRSGYGARARTYHPHPGGFGKPARPALRPAREEHRCTAAGRFAGNARLKAPVKEARNWSWAVAFGRLSESRGGTPTGEPRPKRGAGGNIGLAWRGWLLTTALVGVPLPFFFFA